MGRGGFYGAFGLGGGLGWAWGLSLALGLFSREGAVGMLCADALTVGGVIADKGQDVEQVRGGGGASRTVARMPDPYIMGARKMAVLPHPSRLKK